MEISPHDSLTPAGIQARPTVARPRSAGQRGQAGESSAVFAAPDRIENNAAGAAGYVASAYRHAREAVLPQSVAEFLNPTERMIYVAHRVQLMMSMPILATALVQGHREWRAGNRTLPLLMPWEGAGEMRLVFWNGAVLYTLQLLTQRAVRRREARDLAAPGNVHAMAVPPRPAAPVIHRAQRSRRAETVSRRILPTDFRLP